MADFSTRLKDIIESKGISQAWLADKAETTEATISRYIAGVHKPNLDIVARICRTLNVSMDYIMDLSLSPTPYREPEKDIVILANAYRRATERDQGFIWKILEDYLTPEEKTTVMPQPPESESEAAG